MPWPALSQARSIAHLSRLQFYQTAPKSTQQAIGDCLAVVFATLSGKSARWEIAYWKTVGFGEEHVTGLNANPNARSVRPFLSSLPPFTSALCCGQWTMYLAAKDQYSAAWTKFKRDHDSVARLAKLHSMDEAGFGQMTLAAYEQQQLAAQIPVEGAAVAAPPQALIAPPQVAAVPPRQHPYLQGVCAPLFITTQCGGLSSQRTTLWRPQGTTFHR